MTDIELGLVLEGEDAEEFWAYLANPILPERGREMLRRAKELHRLRHDKYTENQP